MKLFQRIPKVPFQALLSDMDGTLINSEELLLQAWCIVMERRECDYLTFDKSRIMGMNGTEATGVVLEHFGLDEKAEVVVEEWRKEARALVYANVEVCPGVLETLKLMERRKVPKIVVTTSSTEYSKEVLKQVGIRHRFHETIVSADYVRGRGGRTKPAPDPYLMAARLMGVKPERCLAFEDSELGTISAKQAGCYVISICHGEDLMRRALLRGGADQVLDSLEDFRAAIARVRR